jgi:hypothetical protein
LNESLVGEVPDWLGKVSGERVQVIPLEGHDRKLPPNAPQPASMAGPSAPPVVDGQPEYGLLLGSALLYSLLLV